MIIKCPPLVIPPEYSFLSPVMFLLRPFKVWTNMGRPWFPRGMSFLIFPLGRSWMHPSMNFRYLIILLENEPATSVKFLTKSSHCHKVDIDELFVTWRWIFQCPVAVYLSAIRGWTWHFWFFLVFVWDFVVDDRIFILHHMQLLASKLQPGYLKAWLHTF